MIHYIICGTLFLITYIVFWCAVFKGSMNEYDKALEDEEQMKWIKEHMNRKSPPTKGNNL